jgi:uncharacterized protein (DUF4415 family)
MKKSNPSRRVRELKALAAMPDQEIDTSDIPELTEAQFLTGTRGLLYRPIKKSVTIRLDADVIQWLKGQGPGYQTKANQLLREEMLKSAEGKKQNRSVNEVLRRKRTGTRSR